MFPSSKNAALPGPSESGDQRIARLLWMWSRHPTQFFEDGRNVEQHIASCLEPFLSDSFTYCSEGLCGDQPRHRTTSPAWSRVNSTAFLVFGMTWWAGHDVTSPSIDPFEIEYYFNNEDERDFARTIVRFGLADNNGQRPLRDSAWAMAIELKAPQRTRQN